MYDCDAAVRSTLRGTSSQRTLYLTKVDYLIICLRLLFSTSFACARGSDCCLRSNSCFPHTFSPRLMTHYSGKINGLLAAACGSCPAEAQLFL